MLTRRPLLTLSLLLREGLRVEVLLVLVLLVLVAHEHCVVGAVRAQRGQGGVVDGGGRAPGRGRGEPGSHRGAGVPAVARLANSYI